MPGRAIRPGDLQAIPSGAAAKPSDRLFFGILGSILLLEFVWLGWAPISRPAWLLENMLSVALVVGLVATRRRFRFSRAAYLSIFGFLVLHEVGSHYTYSLVPYDDAARAVFGVSISELTGAERNHYDRFIHFIYGALFYLPLRELLQAGGLRWGWSAFVAAQLVMSSSLIYELIEWSAAALFGGDLGMAYLGTQGDVWDAHKDMLLAGVGALLAVALDVAVRIRSRAVSSAPE